MRKRTLKKKLAKTEKKLHKITTELRHTKDQLNAIIAGPEEDEIVLDDGTVTETVAARLEKFFHP
jgi:hypothetical protein